MFHNSRVLLILFTALFLELHLTQKNINSDLTCLQNTAQNHIIIMEGRLQVSLLSGTGCVYPAHRSLVSVMGVVGKSDSRSFNTSHFVEWETKYKHKTKQNKTTTKKHPKTQQQQKTQPHKPKPTTKKKKQKNQEM